MKSPSDLIESLPELPIELFERSSRLAFSEHAPVIRNRIEPVVAKPPAVPTPLVKRSSHEIRTYHAWVIYPHVVCTPMTEPEAVTALRLERRRPPTPSHAADLAAISQVRQFYKLSQFRGQPLATPWGCEVRHGPWFGTVTCTQSCDDQVPDRWSLSSAVLSMEIEWYGSADDMPQVADLIVVWDPNQPANVTWQCCPGHRWCPASQSCLPDQINCPGLTPQ